MKGLPVTHSFETLRTARLRPQIARRALFDVARGIPPAQARRYVSGDSNQRPSASSPPKHLGLLAAVAFFSTTLGYSLSEWRTRSSSGHHSDSPNYASPTEVAAAIGELKATFPDKGVVITDSATLRTYGFSENSYHPSSPHSVVVRVKSTEDVSRVMKIANRFRVPVIPYGGGTSLEGHFSGVSTRLAL
jgi:D-lactate dehydrogenase (cytochrome)